ncbi:hypothetical protein IV38_GL001929 [Lactobacillus selangorensis]|uniref:Competence protein ComGF n=2 Tax=Lactobacillus selangorensis TaxID=81857 RepID=A0A0R2FSS1_9LACO|nr:ComGF family competence protein [Lactobacillus selangorensis]KRN27716.1 hypothetical protein IV38_GL001929 [Lactobacillus selangorensis]KRN30319.1 hypothetical protein IV40_GL001908 [Lactobacillus selangorensis]
MLEVVCALFVLLLSVRTIAWEVDLFQRFQQKTAAQETANWEVAVLQLDEWLETENVRFKEIKANDHDQSVVSFLVPVKDKKGKVQQATYRLEPYEDLLRLTSHQGGHMPLLDSVSSFKATYQEPWLDLKIRSSHHQTYHEVWYVETK